jgi:3'-phosphoadenosine 5'-phosphosulfate sulfotransferase (PAPS reductase)/FAD synthetase
MQFSIFNQDARRRGVANADRIITLNCGLGRDSLTMLALLCEGQLHTEMLGTLGPDDVDVVVFSNTGCEWPHTYRLIPRVSQICDDHNIPFLVLHKGDHDDADAEGWGDIERKAEQGGYHLRPPIMDDFESRATVASLGKGDCTDNHKIQPIRRLLNDISLVRFGLDNVRYSWRVRKDERLPHVTLIGIAADETSRLRPDAHGPHYVTEAYPLVDMDIAKADEVPILERWSLGHVKKSGCFMCPYQPASWFWALRETEPATYERVVEYERIALDRNPRMAATGYKRNGDPMTIPEVVARWRENNPGAGVEEVLAKTYTRCTKEARKAQKAAFEAEEEGGAAEEAA